MKDNQHDNNEQHDHHSASNPDDFSDAAVEELIALFVLNEITPPQRAQLTDLANRNPDIKQRLFQEERMHALLHAADAGPAISTIEDEVLMVMEQDSESHREAMIESISIALSSRGVPPPTRQERSAKQNKRTARIARHQRTGRNSNQKSIALWAYAFAATAALLLIAISLYQFNLKNPSSAAKTFSITQVTGDVQLAGKRIRAGLTSPYGASIDARKGKINITLHEGTKLSLEGQLQLNQNALQLAAGSVALDVKPQQPDRPFLIETPDARMTVLGTRLKVNAHASWTRLDVTHGKVAIQQAYDSQQQAIVTAGHYAVARQNIQLQVNPITEGLIADYRFHTRPLSMSVVPDESGIGKPMDLKLEGMTRQTASGLSFIQASAHTQDPATKLQNAIHQSKEITVELWCTPTMLTQAGPARIFCYATDYDRRTLVLAHGDISNKRPKNQLVVREEQDLKFIQVVKAITKGMQHYVVVRDATEIRLYAQGALIASRSASPMSEQNLGEHVFSLGDDPTPNRPRPWQGTFHRVRLFSRAMTHQEIHELYQRGLE